LKTEKIRKPFKRNLAAWISLSLFVITLVLFALSMFTNVFSLIITKPSTGLSASGGTAPFIHIHTFSPDPFGPIFLLLSMAFLGVAVILFYMSKNSK